MASGKIDKPANTAIRVARFYPTLISGGSGFSGTSECYYYRYGPIVVATYMFWNFTITNPNSSAFYLSLPFNCYSARNYGLVGYDNKGILGYCTCAAGSGINANAFGFFAKNSTTVLSGS